MHTDNSTDAPQAAQPKVKKNRSVSVVWVIPILGILLGVWLLFQHFENKGPLVTINFNDAEGLVAGKTEIRCNSVLIGKVESIELASDLRAVIKVRIDKDFTHFVREDSRFWVARPRISGSSVTGLETLISGSYIALDPGQEKGARKRSFEGLEEPPITPSSVPGLRLTLTATKVGSIHVGSRIFLEGTAIGKIERCHFNTESCATELGVFIEERYTSLISQQTKFWRDGGFQLNITTEGFKVDLPSFDSLISGRISISSPKEILDPLPVESGSTFVLFANEKQASGSTFDFADEFVLLVDQSVRGLSQSAPVEFRGLRIGRVKEISYGLLPDVVTDKIPILIQLDKMLLAKHFPLGLKSEAAGYLELAAKGGLRASLKSSSLITGQLIIDLDYYPDLPLEPILEVAGYKVLPTVTTGLARIEDSLAAALDKVNELPVESLFTELQIASKEGTATLSKIREVLDDKDGVLSATTETMKQAKFSLEALQVILKDDNVRKIPEGIIESIATLKKLLDNKDLNQIAGDLRLTLGDVRGAVKPIAPGGNMHGDLLRTMEEMRSAIRAIEKTVKVIGDKPNSIIFGKDKSSREIPKAKR